VAAVQQEEALLVLRVRPQTRLFSPAVATSSPTSPGGRVTLWEAKVFAHLGDKEDHDPK